MYPVDAVTPIKMDLVHAILSALLPRLDFIGLIQQFSSTGHKKGWNFVSVITILSLDPCGQNRSYQVTHEE